MIRSFKARLRRDKLSVAWNGVNYAIYNNSGASVFIAASLSRLRNIN